MVAVARSWSSRTRLVASAMPLELRDDAQVVLRFIFNGWESLAGVKSNHGAQVERLAAGMFREAIEGASHDVQRAEEALKGELRYSIVTGRWYPKKIPLSERGWPRMTARPTGSHAGGFPMRTVQLPADKMIPSPVRVTVASPEEWALLPRKIMTAQGPIERSEVTAMYRALRAMNGSDAKSVVVLHLLYGPRSSNVDYHVFNELAPIVHLTPAAEGLAREATRAMKLSLATACFDDLQELGRRAHIAPDVIAQVDALRDFWISTRCDEDRRTIEPKQAIEHALRAGVNPEIRKNIRERLKRDASQLRVRAHAGLHTALREGKQAA